MAIKGVARFSMAQGNTLTAFEIVDRMMNGYSLRRQRRWMNPLIWEHVLKHLESGRIIIVKTDSVLACVKAGFVSGRYVESPDDCVPFVVTDAGERMYHERIITANR